MPISELDIFESLMKDPNHAYNPLGKVWQEAQQRARQFRNNEKALALAFDESPLEKLFEFVQKAEDDDYGNPADFIERVKNNWLSNRASLRRLNTTMKKFGETYGGDFGWQENRGESIQPMENVTYNVTANSPTITDNIYSIGEDYERNGPILESLLTLGREGIGEGMEGVLQNFFTPDGNIKPELIAQASAMTQHEVSNDFSDYTLEQRQEQDAEVTSFEESSGAARGEGPSDEERDALFSGGSTPNQDLGTGMIEDDEQSEGDTSATGDTGAIEETPEEEVEYPPFTLQTLNDLIERHKRGNQHINIPVGNAGWANPMKLTSPQFNTLRNLGIVSGDNFRAYEWTHEGESVRRLLTHGNRTQAPRGREAQPLNDEVFQALVHAVEHNYITGHIPETSINEERNSQVDPNSPIINTEDGDGQETTGERENITLDNIGNVSPEGWEDYMLEYPHKQMSPQLAGYEDAQLLASEHHEPRTLLLPRELGSWENGQYTEGAPINPFIDAQGNHLNDMDDAYKEVHLQDMFRRLLDIFHASNHRGDEEYPRPDSIPNRFGTPEERRGRNYYTIDVTSDGFPKDAYNSYLENNGVLEKYLLKFGELLGINTDRQVQSLVNDQDTGAKIQNHENRVIDRRTGEPTEQPINPATGEPYPYTAADIDRFIEENDFPEDLKTLTWGDTRNRQLGQDHPAYRGGIYTPSYSGGDDIYIHEGSWAWADALYSLGLVDPDTGYPAFHMLSRNEYDRQGGHGLDYRKIWNGVTTIQGLLNVREMEGEDPLDLFKTFHEQDKRDFIERHPGAGDGSYAEAWNDYQRFLGNPTAEHDPARILPETDLSEEEEDIRTRRESMPDFWTWTHNFLNGSYQDALGELWPLDLKDAENRPLVTPEGVGPNGQRRMNLYKEDRVDQAAWNQPLEQKSDRMERWMFSDQAVGEQRQQDGVRPQPEGQSSVTTTTGQPEGRQAEGTATGTATTETAATRTAANIPEVATPYAWYWNESKTNPFEGKWEWKQLTEEERNSGRTLPNQGLENPEPDVPEDIVERNKLIRRVLDHEFPEGWENRLDDDDVQVELEQLLRYHNTNQLVNHHEKTVVSAARKAREESRKPGKPEAEVKPEDKPFTPNELERMIDAYKSAVQNRTQEPMSTEMENWLRDIAARNPKQFRHDYGEAIKLNEKFIADTGKKQRERDANDIEGYRGILPLQQMPTEDDIKTQIRRLEYWKNKHGEHMSDKAYGIWNQRWQEISQAAANIPDFDIEQFMAEDKAQAEAANMEYGGEDHLKAAGKAHVKEMYGNASYMNAVGDGANLRSNRNYKPWLVVKYDSNGAGTLHDLRQRDDVTGEWGKRIDPNSLAFDEDTHYFDYNETPNNQPQQSAAEKFWSKMDRYANFRPVDHRGALERFDNDDAVFANTKGLLGEQGTQYGWFHPESGAWINPHRYNDIREELTNAGPGSGMVIPAGEHYHGSHRPSGQGEANPRYAFARRGKAKIAQMNNNNDLSYYVDSQGNISHADGEWPVVQQRDTTQPQSVNDVIHDYYSQQFYNYFTQTGDSFKDANGNFLSGKVLRPQQAPQQPMQQMELLKDVFPGDALERRRLQGDESKAQPGSKNLQADELGHSGEFWGRNQEYQQRYQDVLDFTGSGLLGWLGGIINPFAVAADVQQGSSPLGKVGRGVKGVVSRTLGQKDPAYQAIRRIRRQYRIDAEAEQKTKEIMDKLQVHGHPMRYLSPGEAKARREDLNSLRSHVAKTGNWHRQEANKMAQERQRMKLTNTPKNVQHQHHEDEDLKFKGITNELNSLNPELDSHWAIINRLYNDHMNNQQVQSKFAPHPSEGDGGWTSRFENPQPGYQPSQGSQQVSGGLSGLIADDSPQQSPLQGLIANDSASEPRSQLQGLIA